MKSLWGFSYTNTYTYDPLSRLTAADYSDNSYYHYTYDAVGNRLSQVTNSSTITYSYDIANRLTNTNGATYTWDANGNLLSNGVKTYTYDLANRLTTFNNGTTTTTYAYNGLGDHLQQTVNSATTTYAVDIAGGLTQVLFDGTNIYLYGAGRIAQQLASLTEYYLDDALGSVRQLTNSGGDVVLARAYDPYGNLVENNAYPGVTTTYGYTGEYTDASGMVYLRARYYSPAQGRFVSRDVWEGDYNDPQSLNKCGYVEKNPIKYTDPSGLITVDESGDAASIVIDLSSNHEIGVIIDWGYVDVISGNYIALAINQSPEWIGLLSQYGCWKWNAGEWSLRELQELQIGIHDLASVMNGKFIRNMGGRLTISQENIGNPGEFYPPDVIKFKSIPKEFPDSFNHWSVVHELSHVWDYNNKWSLSDELMKKTGGHIDHRIPSKKCGEQDWQPGCNDEGYFYGGIPAKGSDVNFNKREDFAESVTAYVYFDEVNYYVKSHFLGNDTLYYKDYRTTPRWGFVNSKLN